MRADRVGSWLRSLELAERRWLAAVSALVVVTGLVLGASALLGGRDAGPDLAVETQGRATPSSGSASADVTASSTTSTADPSVDPAQAEPGADPVARRSGTAPAPPRSTTTRLDARPTPTPGPSSTTSVAPPPSSPPIEVTRDSGVEARIAELFVADRAAEGRPAMARVGSLDRVAADWAQHLAREGRLAHQSLDTIAAACPSPCNAAENVAQNHTADATWSAWLASDTHRANIRHEASGVFGVGAYRSPDGRLWVVHVFGRDRG